MQIIGILVVFWELYWKYQALKLSVQRLDKIWFFFILIIASAGALPIYYLYKKDFFTIK